MQIKKKTVKNKTILHLDEETQLEFQSCHCHSVRYTTAGQGRATTDEEPALPTALAEDLVKK